MPFKTQQSALNWLRDKFGHSAYAIEHVNYKRVGFERGGKEFFAVADTWDEAIETLKRKAQ